MSVMSEADIIRQNRDYEDSIINGDALDELIENQKAENEAVDFANIQAADNLLDEQGRIQAEEDLDLLNQQ